MYMTECVLSISHVAVVAPGVAIGLPPVGEIAPDLQSLFSTTAPATVRMQELKPLSSALVSLQSALSAPPPDVATMMLTTAITTTATTAVAMYQPLLDDDRCCCCCCG